MQARVHERNGKYQTNAGGGQRAVPWGRRSSKSTLLKIVGYDGLYQPTVLIWPPPQPVDWVTPNTEAKRLGYGKDDES